MKRSLLRLIVAGLTLLAGMAQAGFSPTNIAGCRMWLDASAVTGKVDGDRVHRWEDSTANNVDMGTAYSRWGNSADRSPIYTTGALAGRPILQFSADSTYNDYMPSGSAYAPGSQELNLSQTNGSTATLVTVLRDSSSGADWCDWAFSSDRVQFQYGGQIGSQQTPWPTWIGAITKPTSFSIDTLTMQGDMITSQYYRNGTLHKTGAIGSGTQPGDLGNNLVLAAKANTSSGAKVDYAEVIAIQRAINNAENNAINFYLEMKYDLTNAAGGVMLTIMAPGNTVYGGGTLAARGDTLDITDTNRGSVAVSAAAVSQEATFTIGLDLEDSSGPLDTAAVYTFLTNRSDNASFYSVTEQSGDVEFLIAFNGNAPAVHYFEWDFTPLSASIQVDRVSAHVPPPHGTVISIK